VKVFKVLRMLRVLKPLRLVSHNKGLKLSIICLIKALPSILNLMVIVVFFLFLIGILGMTLFSGKFYSCYMADMISEEAGKQFNKNNYHTNMKTLIANKWDCLNYGGEWTNQSFNYDTAMASLLTLTAIQTTEGWVGVMWNSVDAVGRNLSPEVNFNWYVVVMYILLIILICLLFLNLFVGVVIETFNTEKVKLTFNHLLTLTERQWIEV